MTADSPVVHKSCDEVTKNDFVDMLPEDHTEMPAEELVSVSSPDLADVRADVLAEELPLEDFAAELVKEDTEVIAEDLSLSGLITVLENRKLLKESIPEVEIDEVIQGIVLESSNITREVLAKRVAKVAGVKVSEITSVIVKLRREKDRAQSKRQSKNLLGVLGLEVPESYGFDEHGVVLYGPKVNDQLTTKPFWVNSRVYNATEKREELELAWENATDRQTIIIPRSIAYQARELIKYVDQGVPVIPLSVGQLGNFIAMFDSHNEVKLAKSKKTLSTRPGWIEMADKSVEFSAYSIDANVLFKPSMKEIADYLKSKGTLDGWLKLRPIIEKSPKLAFFMAAAATAPLLKFIHASGFMADMWDESGKGKTTTQRVAASMFGLPGGQSVLGLVKPWKATPTYMEEILSVFSDMPVFCMDSQDIANEQTIEDMAYMVANGQGKGRAAKEGGVRPRLEWKSVVISDGETPIYGRLTANGAQARIISVEGSGCGGLDAADVNVIDEIIQENYGLIAPLYIQKVKESAESLPELYKNGRIFFAEKIKPTVQKRFADYFAAILVAAEVLSRVEQMGWFRQLALAATLEVFEQSTQQCVEEKTSKRVLQDIADWASTQRQHFMTNGAAGISAGGKNLGRIKNRVYVAAIGKDLKKYLKDECNIKSMTMLLKEWNRDGVLITDKVGHYKTLPFLGSTAKLVCFDWDRLYPSEEGTVESSETDTVSTMPADNKVIELVRKTLSSATGKLLSIREFKRKDDVINYVDIDGFGGLVLLPQNNYVLEKRFIRRICG